MKCKVLLEVLVAPWLLIRGAIYVQRIKERKRNMPTYIVLGKFTKEGIENIKDSPKRLAQANKLAESFGGKIIAFYYTMGQYDFVSISEGMSLDDALKILLILGKGGAIRTETLVAFPAENAAKLIGELP